MIRLIALAALALAVATSAEAMAPSPQNFRKPCDLPNQKRINGICMLVTPPLTHRPRAYRRRCATWSEGFCAEYY
jgi:hypothetical protein